jgi:hypothetical protein
MDPELDVASVLSLSCMGLSENSYYSSIIALTGQYWGLAARFFGSVPYRNLK